MEHGAEGRDGRKGHKVEIDTGMGHGYRVGHGIEGGDGAQGGNGERGAAWNTMWGWIQGWGMDKVCDMGHKVVVILFL